MVFVTVHNSLHIVQMYYFCFLQAVYFQSAEIHKHDDTYTAHLQWAQQAEILICQLGKWFLQMGLNLE